MSSIVVNGDTSGSVTLSAPAVAGTVTVTLPAASGTMAVLPTATGVLAESAGGTGTTTGYYGFKNRIINGAMVIDQRNAGASVSITDSTVVFLTDRFRFDENTDGSFSAQQVSISPSGFIKSLKFTVTSADTSLAAGQYANLRQNIEGLNVADLAWGTASAATVTLSFWVYSSLTGTFGGSLRNSAADRSYPFTYSISSANTWEQKTITVAGDTTGTWLTTNGIGLTVIWGFGVGSTYLGTANVWQSGNYLAPTGAVSVVGTNAATFYITGVQLEKGSTATSFDVRPYGTELALCQRYFEKSYNYDVAVATSTDTGTVSTRSPQADMQDTIQFAVDKRATADIVYYTGLGVINNWRDVTAGTNKGMTTAASGTRQFTWANGAGMTVGNVLRGHWTASSEL